MCEHPGEADLARRHAMLCGDPLDYVDYLDDLWEVLCREPRVSSSDVVLREVIKRILSLLTMVCGQLQALDDLL